MIRFALYDRRAIGWAAAAIFGIGSLFIAQRSHRMLRILVPDTASSVQIQDIAQDFQKKNKVNVSVTALDYEMLRMTLNQMSRDEEPEYDILLINDPLLPGLAAKGVLAAVQLDDGKGLLSQCLLALDTVLSRLKLKQRKDRPKVADFEPRLIELCKYGDRYYAVPYTGNYALLAYNPRLLNEEASFVPQSWDDILRARPGTKGRYRFVMRLDRVNPIVADTFAVLASDMAGTGSSKANYSQSIKTLRGLLQDHTPPDPMRLKSFDVYDYLSRGEAAAGVIWSAWIPTLHEANPDLQFTALPGGHSVIGGWLLACTNQCESYAREFIEFAAFNGDPPANKVGLRDWMETHAAYVHLSPEVIEKATARPRKKNWTCLEDGLSRVFAPTLLASTQVEERTAEMALAMERIFKPDLEQPCPGVSPFPHVIAEPALTPAVR